MKARYIQVFRRRREGKTDYKKRRAVIVSRLPFASIFISSKHVYGQISIAHPEGDHVIASANSIQLKKEGWIGSGKCLPACYLTGLLLGKRAREAGLSSDVILYTGLRSYISGSRIAAFAKGLLDSGVKLLVDQNSLPSDERLSGKHIEDYAKKVKEEKADDRMKSYLLAREELRNNFEAVRSKILGEVRS